MIAALYAFSACCDPRSARLGVALGGVALGCLVGWLASRRDANDARRLQRMVEALTERDLGSRVRLQRSGQLGDLGRSLDALGERLSASEEKKHRRKDRLQTILDAMAEAVMVTDSRGRITLSNEC